MNENQNEAKDPTYLFFNNAKKTPWVIDLYVAIQAALALGVERVSDFNDLADNIMPRPDRTVRAGYALEHAGLEVLGILFNCECIERGNTDYHEYKFTRKADGKSVVGTVKV